MTSQIELFIEVPQNLEPDLATAVVRVRSLYPSLSIIQDGAKLQCLFPDDLDSEKIKQEILDAVYRESIFNRTLKIRERIHGS